MNKAIEQLQPYPFEKLAELVSNIDVAGEKSAINLSVGEPKHPTPPFILDSLRDNLKLAANYPKTRGDIELREAIATWLSHRFSLAVTSIDAGQHVLPVNGTREALFAFAQCHINRDGEGPVVVTSNPFYQIYEGAALLAGATPWYVNSVAADDFETDYDAVPESIWQRCQLLYMCSPNNPTGNVARLDTIKRLLELADKYDFVIASDECYSEIYLDEAHAPLGLLEAASMLGRDDFKRCMVFHSLSKRSNVPGMRSGFVAGDAELISRFFKYRTYHGSAMAPYTQQASIVAWKDEGHVRENRRLYREKFLKVIDILRPVMNVRLPAATFYLWAETPQSDIEFARGLFQQQNVTVLPGRYLSREVNGVNPGENRIRIALVASLEECEEAANRISTYINEL
ncbi:MAG: N-succinyldiaminopimelate aminotransferase [Gammaproteobacteria bacterium]|jgi:N-succinyldiaminopimelate aminotransferase